MRWSRPILTPTPRSGVDCTHWRSGIEGYASVEQRVPGCERFRDVRLGTVRRLRLRERGHLLLALRVSISAAQSLLRKHIENKYMTTHNDAFARFKRFMPFHLLRTPWMAQSYSLHRPNHHQL